MEGLLENIKENTERTARNTDPKSSFYILVSKNKSRIVTKYNPLIQLNKDRKHEMALVNLETYYSFPNIDAKNNNFRYSPDAGSTWFDINVPEGCYEVADVDEYLQRIMKENGHLDTSNDTAPITVEPNSNTLKSVLKIEEGYRVDLTPENSIRTVLGFESRVYAPGYNESENIVNIMNITSLRVTSDVIASSYANGSTENVIYSFFPNVGPGFKIIEVPTNLIYLPVTLDTISRIETKLTDQNGNLVNLRGEDLAIRFHIREV